MFKLKAGVWGPYFRAACRVPAPQGPRGGLLCQLLSKGEGGKARPSNVRAPEGQLALVTGLSCRTHLDGVPKPHICPGGPRTGHGPAGTGHCGCQSTKVKSKDKPRSSDTGHTEGHQWPHVGSDCQKGRCRWGMWDVWGTLRCKDTGQGRGSGWTVGDRCPSYCEASA